MEIQKVTDTAFAKYGKVMSDIPVERILKEMEHTPLYFSLDRKVDKRLRLHPNNSVVLQWNKQGDKYNFLPRNRSFLGRKSEFPAQGIVPFP